MFVPQKQIAPNLNIRGKIQFFPHAVIESSKYDEGDLEELLTRFPMLETSGN